MIPLSACTGPCGSDPNSGWQNNCRTLKSNLIKTQTGGFASCSGAVNSRKIQISCGRSSGTNSTCTSRSNGSGYLFVMVPNNNGGSFIDSNYVDASSNPIPMMNCNDLWNAMNAPAGTRPVGILGVYFSNTSSGDVVSCTDVGGCTASPSNCVAAWDPVLQSPSTTAASLANGSYLSCAYLDSVLPDGTGPFGFPPTPATGLIGTSSSSAYSNVTLSNPVANPVNLNSWTDY